MKEEIHLLISAAWSDACRERERLLDNDTESLELIESIERACRVVAHATNYEGHLSGDERPAWAEEYRAKLERATPGDTFEASDALKGHPTLLEPNEWSPFNGAEDEDGAEPQKDDCEAPGWADDLDAAVSALQAGFTLRAAVLRGFQTFLVTKPRKL